MDKQKNDSTNEDWLAEFVAIIERKMDHFDVNVEDIAVEMQISRTHFFRKVKDLTGLTPNQFLLEKRLQKAHDLLEIGAVDSVKAAFLSVGFKKSGYFSKKFKERFGYFPSEVMKK